MQGQKKQCCPPGSWPALISDYQAKGEILQIGGTSVYHIGNSDKVLIIVSDIFGASSGRHRGVADTFAKLGFNVYIPEILINPYSGQMDGSKIMQNIKGQDWEKMENRFLSLKDYLKQKGNQEFYGVGFCWGVYAAFKLASKHSGFKAIAAMHPSLGCAGAFGENQLQFSKSIKCPAFFYPAGNDPANVKQGGEHVQILAQRFGKDKTGSLQFPHEIHGWVVRSDITKQVHCKAVEKAIKQGSEYLKKF